LPHDRESQISEKVHAKTKTTVMVQWALLNGLVGSIVNRSIRVSAEWW
jgi:hypothetical protein